VGETGKEVERMRRSALIALCLLFGLLVGLSLRPDDGTPVSITNQSETAAAVIGANHAKPLPRTVQVADLLVGIELALGLALVAAAVAVARRFWVAAGEDGRLPRSALLVHACTRRGPPALI
jgi:hypothetical protein